MMKENSPICARLMPACTEVRVPLPVRNAPSDTAITLPTITTTVRTSTGTQCSAISAGSMSMPTETKKMAANMSRTGATRCSIFFTSPDSATSEPPMNAPSATE